MIQIIMIVAILVLVAVDQIIKYMINTNMVINEIKEVIPNFFSLHYVKNNGAAFSILSGRRWALIIVTSIILVGLVVYLLIRIKKKISKLEQFSLVFIISGGIGNLIDRIFRDGLVTDYISFDFVPVFNAIFNFADCLVTVGVGLFILSFILDLVKEKKQKILVKKSESEKKTEAISDSDE